jgi:phosphopantetheinyl transferase (holo-ACP synthase)
MLVYFYRNAEHLAPEHLECLVDTMPKQQQDIVAHYKSHRQKCEQAIAYTMLCHALKNDRDLINDSLTTIKAFPHSALRFTLSVFPLWAFGEHGKPYITNYEGIHFNISHCKEAVAIGISNRTIGIDIEGRRRFSDTLLERAFNDDEKAIVKNCDDPQKEFACIWTRKEAYFKWTGTGILMDHLKTTETEARNAGCIISTSPIIDTEQGQADFWLSIAK